MCRSSTVHWQNETSPREIHNSRFTFNAGCTIALRRCIDRDRKRRETWSITCRYPANSSPPARRFSAATQITPVSLVSSSWLYRSSFMTLSAHHDFPPRFLSLVHQGTQPAAARVYADFSALPAPTSRYNCDTAATVRALDRSRNEDSMLRSKVAYGRNPLRRPKTARMEFRPMLVRRLQ